MTDKKDEPSPLQRLIAAHPGIWSKDAPSMSWVPDGWYPIVDRVLTEIRTTLGDDITRFRVEQIKEKYASLRLYYSWSGRARLNVDAVSPAGRARFAQRAPDAQTQRVDELIAEAEAACARACQSCGAPGRRRDLRGWLVTLCNDHARKAKAEDIDDE